MAYLQVHHCSSVPRISSRNIKAGEVVIAERAVAFLPRAQYHTAVCHSCCCDFTESVARVKCSSCDSVVYCQVVDGVESIHVGGRLEDGIINSSFQDALGLQTHQDKMSKAWRISIRKGCEALHKAIVKQSEGKLDFDMEELEWMASLVNTNAHGMGAQGLHNTDVALGIFPFVSMLNHSCRPNCCFASEGNVMYVRALQEISTDTEGCMCTVKGCGGVLLKTSSLDGCTFGDEKLTSWICDTCSRVLDPSSFDPSDFRGKPITETPWDLVGQAEEKVSVAVSAYKERRLKDARTLLENFYAEFNGKLEMVSIDVINLDQIKKH